MEERQPGVEHARHRDSLLDCLGVAGGEISRNEDPFYGIFLRRTRWFGRFRRDVVPQLTLLGLMSRSGVLTCGVMAKRRDSSMSRNKLEQRSRHHVQTGVEVSPSLDRKVVFQAGLPAQRVGSLVVGVLRQVERVNGLGRGGG